MRVLLTGASGFLGGAAAAALEGCGFEVRRAMRAQGSPRDVAIGDLRGPVDWGPALDGCDIVVHLAAIAHTRATASDIDAVNARAPAMLAAAAAKAGVRRMVFVSSVKAVGEDSGDAIWTEEVAPAPTTTYGAAKRAAETGVLAAQGIETIVLRPPLVHAADARANFARLLELAALPVPPPLGGIANRRSFISRAGLARRIAAAARPGAAPGVYFVCEDPPLSTSETILALRRGMGRAQRLAPAPGLLRGLSALRPLFGSLAVSEAKFRAAFPGLIVRDSLATLEDTARAWAQARRR
jgi:UDP-glucose 4-epimerase